MAQRCPEFVVQIPVVQLLPFPIPAASFPHEAPDTVSRASRLTVSVRRQGSDE
jgi:hypothetical protein